MEILLFISAVLVAWFCFWWVRNYFRIGTIKQQTRDYLRTYQYLRDVTMTYASRDVLFVESLQQVLSKWLSSSIYDIPTMARTIVESVSQTALPNESERDRFRSIVTYAIIKTMCCSSFFNTPRRELETMGKWYQPIFNMVSDIFPESI